MSDGLGDAPVDLRAEAATPDAAQASPVCPSCGMKLPPFRPAERCPVCQLRGVLDEESALVTVGVGPITEAPDKGASALSLNRLDHYELLTHSDGRAVGQTMMSTSSQSLPGLGWGSRHWSTIGSDG